MRILAAIVASVFAFLACATAPVDVGPAASSDLPDSRALLRLGVAEQPGEAEAYRYGAWDPAYFDALIPAASLEIDGLRNRHVREGVGLPLVGVRNVSEDDPDYYPREGITRALTAVTLHTETGPVLRLLDPTRTATVMEDEVRMPLAADFTAPYAVLLSRTELEQSAILGAFDYSEIQAQEGIFLLEPYDPDRVPLLMVHGLLSSPITWMELTNEVFGAPELRRRYQVWHAIYPTGIPFLHSAANFRDQLAGLRRSLDPEGDDFATSHIVVVAHSKGGLLSKTLVADSGDRLWEGAFTVAPEELVATPTDLAATEDYLFFERDPSVRRVIFIATPHRGSRLAENALARFLASWVVLPGAEAATFERVLRENRDVVAEDFRPRLAGMPSGPRALSSEDPLIRILGDLPIHEDVPFHTILGAAGPGLLSDGVVEHASSRQEGAESELVVQGADHSVHTSPTAIAEVLRILREHEEAPGGRLGSGQELARESVPDELGAQHDEGEVDDPEEEALVDARVEPRSEDDPDGSQRREDQ